MIDAEIAKFNEELKKYEEALSVLIVGGDEKLQGQINDLKDQINNLQEQIDTLEGRVDKLEQDVNKEITTLATALLGAGTILSLGAVYFIFGNRFFPVDTRRSYQHVYIKDGVSKVRHTKSQHKK
jgi:outer membrane murein-binding lipoprotein Lpp